MLSKYLAVGLFSLVGGVFLFVGGWWYTSVRVRRVLSRAVFHFPRSSAGGGRIDVQGGFDLLGFGVFVVMVVLAGLAAGIGFMVGRGRAAVAQEQARSWKETAERIQSERDAAAAQARQERDAAVEQARRERDTEVAQARSERDHALEQARQERVDADEQLELVRTQLQAAGIARAAAETELAALQKRHTDELDAMQQRHTDELARAHRMTSDTEAVTKQVAQAAVEAASEVVVQQLVTINDQRAQATAREFDKRESAFDAMIKPVVEQVSATALKIDERWTELEKQKSAAEAKLYEQSKQSRADRDLVLTSINEMLKEVSQFKNVFRKPEARGLWGEQTLRSVVERAGLVDKIDFDAQLNFGTVDGNRRPDMMIHITSEMRVVIDAKAPFNALIEASEARDEDQMRKKLAQHAQHVRSHVKQLHEKRYWELPEKSPEFVIMFLPSDSFLQVALEHDPGLQGYADERHILLATPSTLMAILKCAAAVLRYDKQARNAKETVAACKELVKRLTKLSEHMRNMGTHLGKSVQHYNAAVGSMEGRVLVTAREVQRLQGEDASIPELSPVELAPRQVTSAPADLPAGPDTAEADSADDPTAA